MELTAKHEELLDAFIQDNMNNRKQASYREVFLFAYKIGHNEGMLSANGIISGPIPNIQLNARLDSIDRQISDNEATLKGIELQLEELKTSGLYRGKREPHLEISPEQIAAWDLEERKSEVKMIVRDMIQGSMFLHVKENYVEWPMDVLVNSAMEVLRLIDERIK